MKTINLTKGQKVDLSSELHIKYLLESSNNKVVTIGITKCYAKNIGYSEITYINNNKYEQRKIVILVSGKIQIKKGADICIQKYIKSKINNILLQNNNIASINNQSLKIYTEGETVLIGEYDNNLKFEIPLIIKKKIINRTILFNILFLIFSTIIIYKIILYLNKTPGEILTNNTIKSSSNNPIEQKKNGSKYNFTSIPEEKKQADISTKAVKHVSKIKPTEYKKFKQEGEYPYYNSTGRIIWRSNASKGKVLGQIGCNEKDNGWPARPGEVIYRTNRLQSSQNLMLTIRYSKNTDNSVPIYIYIDAEAHERAKIIPKNTNSWNSFIEEKFDIGKIGPGVHKLKFYTKEGQEGGIFDIDYIALISK